MCGAVPTWVVRFSEKENFPLCSGHLGLGLEASVKAGKANFQILYITDAAGAKCCFGMAGIEVSLEAIPSLGRQEKVIEKAPVLRSKASVEVLP
jgi:hypothetical protein